jgi:hypothetical protein
MPENLTHRLRGLHLFLFNFLISQCCVVVFVVFCLDLMFQGHSQISIQKPKQVKYTSQFQSTNQNRPDILANFNPTTKQGQIHQQISVEKPQKNQIHQKISIQQPPIATSNNNQLNINNLKNTLRNQTNPQNPILANDAGESQTSFARIRYWGFYNVLLLLFSCC